MSFVPCNGEGYLPRSMGETLSDGTVTGLCISCQEFRPMYEVIPPSKPEWKREFRLSPHSREKLNPNFLPIPRRGREKRKESIMSAYIVGRKHIDYIVTAAVLLAERSGYGLFVYSSNRDGAFTVSRETADELGRILWAENLASLKYRYPGDSDGTRPGPNDFSDSDVETYRWTRHGEATLDRLGDIALALRGLSYQSCEHPGWKDSLAHEIMQALEESILATLSDREGSKTWEVA